MVDSSENSSDESDEGSSFHYWNNWKPKSTVILTKRTENVKTDKTIRENIVETNAIRNWLPPKDFGSKNILIYSRKLNNVGNSTVVEEKNRDEASIVLSNLTVNGDWGPRINSKASLGDIEEGDTIWMIMNPGDFGNLRLCVNEYGHIIHKAAAEIKIHCTSERVYIQTAEETVLRKLLAVPNREWTALTDTIILTGETLSYSVESKTDGKTMGTLQQLWFGLCQRRYFLPVISIRLRRAGIFKQTQFWRILPKFVIEDIRTSDGREIND